MSYKSEDLIREIRDRRTDAGVSQRALAARSGLTQAHISQIETGALEPGLSSFIDVARALDLEIVLVPKKFLPAVQGILRQTSTEQSTPQEGEAALREIARGERLELCPRGPFPRRPGSKQVRTVRRAVLESQIELCVPRQPNYLLQPLGSSGIEPFADVHPTGGLRRVPADVPELRFQSSEPGEF